MSDQAEPVTIEAVEQALLAAIKANAERGATEATLAMPNNVAAEAVKAMAVALHEIRAASTIRAVASSGTVVGEPLSPEACVDLDALLRRHGIPHRAS